MQADTYMEIGLPLLAQERYWEALTYAEAVEQLELQAESYWGLADVAKKQTEYKEALAYFQTAQALYEKLDNPDQA